MRCKPWVNILTSLTLFFLLATATPISAQISVASGDATQGETLFKANCTTCHPAVTRKGTGPMLKDIHTKYAGDEEWLGSWIRNSPKMIFVDKDAKAIALWEANNKAAMNAFPTFTDQDISNLLAYIKVESEPKAPVNTVNNVAGQPTDPFADPTIYYGLLTLIAALFIVALLLVVIAAILVTSVRSKEGKEPFEFANVMETSKAMLQNKFVITLITVFVLVGGLAKTIMEARTVGLHQGYMPEQPINFSHKIHAGEYEIDCKYCHTGTTKSKSAWIPSVNVCMNCHKAIYNRHEPTERHPDAMGDNDISPEIAKIYKAVGWDPEEVAYIEGYEQQPIEWIRIHNIPDHAYFNHAQHVVVGNLECQTCHGPVEEMEVVYQYSDLGMGWCINCHRNEKVKVLGEPTDYTVADMGGLDCARCHY
ncbi:MAG: c-type cytochrome [Bacteroidia bacterium]|nr:c-type cytochrome [Bacteroidia bacterium]